MMLVAMAAVLLIAMLVFVFMLRGRDLPEAAPVSPYAHLEAKKAAIYENLRDLQFEYRVGKLSDDDYQSTKTGLQNELAAVLAEIDKVKGAAPPAVVAAKNGKPAAAKTAPNTCPHCKATFDRPLKFCGECGKPMSAEVRA
jgi:hypothetical protein